MYRHVLKWSRLFPELGLNDNEATSNGYSNVHNYVQTYINMMYSYSGHTRCQKCNKKTLKTKKNFLFSFDCSMVLIALISTASENQGLF